MQEDAAKIMDNYMVSSNLKEVRKLIKKNQARQFRDILTPLHALDKRRYHEAPNYRLVPVLAWVYYRVGDIKRAQDYVQSELLIFNIEASINHCVYGANQPDLKEYQESSKNVYFDIKWRKNLPHEMVEAAVSKACSETFSSPSSPPLDFLFV